MSEVLVKFREVGSSLPLLERLLPFEMVPTSKEKIIIEGITYTVSFIVKEFSKRYTPVIFIVEVVKI